MKRKKKKSSCWAAISRLGCLVSSLFPLFSLLISNACVNEIQKKKETMLSRQHPCGPSPLFNSRNSIGHCPQRCQESKKEVCHSEKKSEKPKEKKKKRGKERREPKAGKHKKKNVSISYHKKAFFSFLTSHSSLARGNTVWLKEKKKAVLNSFSSFIENTK